MLAAIRWLGCVVVLCAAALPSVGCVAIVRYERLGEPLMVTSEKARDACEQRQWYELTETRATAVAVDESRDLHFGFAVFEAQEESPEELEDLWLEMHEPALQRAHEARIEPTDRATRHTLYWSLGGIVGMGAGLTGGMLLEEHQTASIAVASTGFVIGVVGIVGALLSMPSGHALEQADARRRMFVPEEDDMAAATRGVNRLNETRRADCASRDQRIGPQSIEP